MAKPTVATTQHERGFWSTPDEDHARLYRAGRDELKARLKSAFEASPPYESVTDDYMEAFVAGTMDVLRSDGSLSKEAAEVVLAEVGRHALTSATARMAEIHAGVVAGRRYSADVIAISFHKERTPDRAAESPESPDAPGASRGGGGPDTPTPPSL